MFVLTVEIKSDLEQMILFQISILFLFQSSEYGTTAVGLLIWESVVNESMGTGWCHNSNVSSEVFPAFPTNVECNKGHEHVSLDQVILYRARGFGDPLMNLHILDILSERIS